MIQTLRKMSVFRRQPEVRSSLEDVREGHLKQAEKIQQGLLQMDQLAAQIQSQQKELEEKNKILEEQKKQLEIQKNNLLEKNILLEEMIFASGGYMWRKDTEGCYLYCDPAFCHDFFGLEVDEQQRICNIRGRSDIDLLNDFRERTGMRHTYGDLCLSTDRHCCHELGRQARYIEIGYIGEELFILDVIKTPLWDDDGCCTGTVGLAWNRSQECDFVYAEIEMGKMQGWIKELVRYNDVAVFWLLRQEQSFVLQRFPGFTEME